MSHTVTVTRTTTTTSTSAIILNTGYLKTLPGLLKLAQVILGGIIIAILVYYKDQKYTFTFLSSALLFFLCIATTFFIASLLLLLSCLCSITTASIIAKTLYEFIYHGAAFLLYLIACLMFLVEVNRANFGGGYYQPFLVASIFGLILTALYLVSSVLAYRSYRGG
ncbi:unnamed protein product [Bemisia tabaci]|nr:PREDICTED: MARVEL domain-containing protein 1 isoform X2 [Bemisia tabaci]CAH0394130.1 unnamed protein product [Bemisia tabaci]